MEQLIFIAIFLLAALVDLLVRWMKGKAKAPESSDDVVIFEEEPDTALEEEIEQWRAREPVVRRREPVLVEQRPKPVRLPAELPPPPVRAPALDEVVARRPVAVLVQPPALPRRRRSRRRPWLTQPESVRRGIVMMAVLGRCRGLE